MVVVVGWVVQIFLVVVGWVVRSVVILSVVVIFIFQILSFGFDGGEGFDGPYKYLCR